MARRPETKGFRRVVAAAAALRKRAIMAVVGATIAAASSLFLLFSLLPGSIVSGRGSVVPALVTVLLVALVAVAARGVRGVARRIQPRGLAGEVDAAVGLGDGDFLGALELERTGPGTSAALAGHHRRRVVRALSRVRSSELLGASRRRWRPRLRAGLGLGLTALSAVALAGLIRPEPTATAAVSLATPWRVAFPKPLPPLQLSPGDTSVVRGDPLEVAVRAPGRRDVELMWRVEGEPARSKTLSVSGTGHAVGETDPIEAPTRYWVVDPEGTASDSFLARPLEPLLVQSLRLRLTFPGYLGRPGETHGRPIPPLIVPEGTLLELEGRANHPLTGAELRLAVETSGGTVTPQESRARAVVLEVEGPRFQGRIVARESATWVWHLVAPSAPGVPLLPEPVNLLVVPDALPLIEVVYPGRDTVLGPEMALPLVVDVGDDIGIATVELLSWRTTPAGDPTGPTERTLGEGVAGQKRAVIRAVLDLGEEDLIPGDTVYYQVRAYDQNRARGPAVSETFRTWVPSLDELREEVARRSDELASEAEALGGITAELERLAREAERQTAAEAGAGVDPAGQEDPDLGFEATEEGRAVMQRAEELQARMEELRGRIEKLGDDLARSALSDLDLRRQLEELAERFRDLTESGLEEQIARLEEALRSLDPEAIRAALERMAEDAARLQEQIRQNASLMERAALEQFLKASRNRAEELAAEQRDVADEVEATRDWAEGEERLAEQAEELARALEHLEERLANADAEATADSAGRAAGRAAEAAAQMRQAAEEARTGAESSDPSSSEANARSAANQAAVDLSEAAAALGAAEEQLAGEWQGEALSAVQEARQEALELALEESRLADRLHGSEALEGPEWQSRQTAVQQGLEKLRKRLSEAGERTALLDPSANAAAEEMAGRLDAMLERMAESGGRRRPSREETEGVAQSLNDLALQLLASERAIQGSRSGTGMEEAMAQMAALAQQQQALTQQTSTMLVPGLEGRAREERAERLAEEQARIGEELEDLGDDGEQLLGQPQELAREAEEIARRLRESGGPDRETLDRQRRLFRRMLDAGRSLEQEDLDPTRRESRTGVQQPYEITDLDPRLLGGPRFPHPSETLLRQLPPHYRPLIFDYFDRLNTRLPPPPTDGGR